MVITFSTAVILPHFNHDRQSSVEQNALDYVSVGLLSYRNDDRLLQ